MRAFGYQKNSGAKKPIELEEVTLAASPEMCRRLAAFLVYAADLMDREGARFCLERIDDITPQG
ncbi:MAG: hypothetical protein U0234_33465 [Sandaracinus sp.]